MANSSIRVTASAAIVRDGGLLLVKFDDASGKHYNLPGGGVDEGETAADACVRECLEEANALITVGRLLLVRDYEPVRCRGKYGKRHKLNLIFAGELLPGSEPSLPNLPDAYQIGVEWVALNRLNSIDLVSPTLPQQLLDALAGAPTQYVSESC